MSQWYGASRSNYVKIADMEGLKKALEPWGDLKIHSPAINSEPGDLVCLLVDSGEGWPSYGEDEAGNEIEFDPAVQICPFMAPGQVLVMMESGHEKLRYVTGIAFAYHSDGRSVHISLTDIYYKAADEFGVPVESISAAEY